MRRHASPDNRACRRLARTARCGHSSPRPHHRRPWRSARAAARCRAPPTASAPPGSTSGNPFPDPPRSPNRRRWRPRPHRVPAAPRNRTATSPVVRRAPDRARPSASDRPDTSTGTGSRCGASAAWPESTRRRSLDPLGPTAAAPTAPAGAGSRPRVHRRQCRRVLSAGQAENVAVSRVKPGRGHRWMLRMRSPCPIAASAPSPETTRPNTV